QPVANGRSVTVARWNAHYLLPKANTLNDDSYPPSPLIPPFNPYTPDPNGFIPPDWAFVTREYGADPLVNPNTDTNARPVTVVGRYAYAVYAEGGLLDMNLAGYPTGTTAAQSGRKGSVAYANLGWLGGTTSTQILNPDANNLYQVDRLVGWRNYATTQPTSLFPSSNFAANFQSGVVPATNFYNNIIGNTNGFLSPSTATWNNRTDQVFIQRQGLIAFRKAIGSTSSFTANTLQYLNTFSRETNAPSFSPSTPAGSSI